jgi:hypothetical protein
MSVTADRVTSGCLCTPATQPAVCFGSVCMTSSTPTLGPLSALMCQLLILSSANCRVSCTFACHTWVRRLCVAVEQNPVPLSSLPPRNCTCVAQVTSGPSCCASQQTHVAAPQCVHAAAWVERCRGLGGGKRSRRCPARCQTPALTT